MRIIRRSSACQLGFVAGIDIGDDDGGARDIDLVAGRQPSLDDIETDLRARAERGANRLLESFVGGQNDHSGLDSRSYGSADTHS